MTKQKTKGKNSPIAGRDINNSHIGDKNVFYFDSLGEDTDELDIVNEIFKNVLQKIDSNEYVIDTDHLNLSDKIKLNFKNKDEQVAVNKYCNYALTKIDLIERRLQEETTETQKDLQTFVYQKYYNLKKEKSSIDILHKLFDLFVPPKKKKDIRYKHLSKAFVLFFFEDCTIFEKTEKEKLC